MPVSKTLQLRMTAGEKSLNNNKNVSHELKSNIRMTTSRKSQLRTFAGKKSFNSHMTVSRKL